MLTLEEKKILKKIETADVFTVIFALSINPNKSTKQKILLKKQPIELEKKEDIF